MRRIIEMIKLLIPPMIVLLYRSYKYRNKKAPFSGVYNSIDEINDQNPWKQNFWIELSKDKLRQTGNISQTSFLPTTDLSSPYLICCTIINLLSCSRPCHVLDFGGGTGFAYFKILPYLLFSQNVTYHVADSNVELSRIGEKHAQSLVNREGIVFLTEIPKNDDLHIDILYINTSLQYIYDYSSLLESLLRNKPQYVILTRLIAGDMKTFITCQNIGGFTTPCVFINIQEIVEIFKKNGFLLVFKSPCSEEIFDGQYDNTIPQHLRIHTTANLIFKAV